MNRLGVLMLRKKTREKAVSAILLLTFFVSGFLVPLHTVWAAQATVDATVTATAARHSFNGSQTVFTTDQIGYKFYVDAGGQCVYSKTTDAGTTWGAAVQIDSKTVCFGVAIWYDKWTPGDSGNFIHIMTMDSTAGDLWYNRLDVTTDTRLLTATPISTVTNSAQGGTLAAGVNTGSVTKGTDGTIYMTTQGTGDSYIVECTTNCGVSTSWTETGTNPLPLASNFSILMPLASGNVLLINRDITNEDILSKVWNNGTGSWSAAWTTIDANALDNATYDSEFSAALNIRTGDIYLAYVDLSTTGTIGGNNDSIKTAVYSGSTWNAKTNVVTNVTATPAGLTDVAVSVDAYTGTVYVAYVGRTTAATATTGNVYYKSSTDGMTNWSAQSAALNTAAADLYGMGLNMTSDQRILVTWAGPVATSVFSNTVADLVPGTVLSAQGTQKTQIHASTSAAYIGGSFAMTETSATRNVTSVTVTQAGTADGVVDLKNVKLYYEADVSAPYDCASETYAGTETQYGSTAVSGFSAANSGTATFTGSVSITTTSAMCMYVVMDVKQSANTKTIDVQVSDPLTQVLVSGSVQSMPMANVTISGSTNVVDSNLTQNHFHWRNDNGNETAATSMTAGLQDITAEVQQETPVRLRVGVANLGATTSSSTKLRLEYAVNPSSCSAISSWTDVNATSDAWDMYNSPNVTNGADTTNISTVSGGITDTNTTFLTPNAGQLDTTSQTSGTVIDTTKFVELEYTIRPSTAIPDGTAYCFRVTDGGAAFPAYTNYPQATVKLNGDFRVQRGISTVANTASTVTITAGVDYDAPSATTSAFIRITNTQLTGAGRSTSAGNSNAADVAVYVSNPENILTSITFTRSGTANDTRVSWEIVEYRGAAGGENEIKVRKAEVLTYTAAAATVNGTVLNNIVDDTDVVAFITGQGNPSAARTAYVSGLSTSNWDGVNNRIVLTRAATTGAVPTSVAAVEFTGTNWKIQRSEHIYTAAGSTETNSITPVNSLSKTFIHVQKRASVNTHANFSHEVWLSGIGQVSFLLDAAATTPAGQASVAWVIENTQTVGTVMDVTRSSGTLATAATFNQANNISIGKTMTDLSKVSLFVNNRSDTNTSTWPEPILGVRIISTTQYELWRSDAAANISYRTEVVEWPTAKRRLEQGYYRFYVDNNAIKPTDPWPAGATNLGENTEMTATDVPLALGGKIRLRMSVSVKGASQPAGTDTFKLQFAPRTTTCSAISTWSSVGDPSSTTAKWRGVNNTPVDGAVLSADPPVGGDLLLSVSTVAGTYDEASPTPANPYVSFPLDQVEYDWVLQDNAGTDKTSYCFRMVEQSGTVLSVYNNYPVIRTVGYEPQITNWRWYDDETSVTPTTALALENVAPSNVAFLNALKLRVVLKEISGAQGTNVKFSLQYSQYSDFSQGVYTLTSTSTCADNSIFCYFNGAGVDNAGIVSKVISNADACAAGVGNGCGTHNEGVSTTSATYDQPPFANTEYEFTLKHAGARSNRVYYFRLWNLTYNEVVAVAPTYSSPSLVTEGAALTFSVGGLNKNTVTAGITTDATTTPTAVVFGAVPINTDFEAAQRISISTNATEGYQVLMYASQQLLNSFNDPVAAISGTNAAPLGWATGCSGVAIGCSGYHTTDATLEGGSSRFGATDSYAALDTTAKEIMYSSIPTTDVQDVVYKLKISQLQAAGDYSTSITYIAVPVH